MPVFRKGELFNGPGGLAWGAKQALVIDGQGEEYRVEHAWSNDYSEPACETYRRNIVDREEDYDSVICGPVQEIDIESLSPIDAFSFGFPCNDYSIVGEQKGMEGKFGPLYSYGVKVLNIHQPKWFIAENVGGLQSANEGKSFLNILHELMNAGDHGYDIVPHLYKFEEYGVPQARHRIIIVGIRRDLRLDFKIPAPTHIGRYVGAQTALEVPPIPENAPNHEWPRHTQKVIEMLNHIPEGGNAWHENIPEHLRLNVKGARMSQIYKRLTAKLPAYTVTGSGGGGTHVYHWSEPRALTNRERARLQTFPDEFVFEGSKEQVRQQIGMAVPPHGAQIIVEAILKTFAGIPYPVDERGPKWTQKDILNQIQLIINI